LSWFPNHFAISAGFRSALLLYSKWFNLKTPTAKIPITIYNCPIKRHFRLAVILLFEYIIQRQWRCELEGYWSLRGSKHYFGYSFCKSFEWWGFGYNRLVTFPEILWSIRNDLFSYAIQCDKKSLIINLKLEFCILLALSKHWYPSTTHRRLLGHGNNSLTIYRARVWHY